MPSPATPQPGDTISHKYRIEGLLGRGRHARVYLARHAVTGREFALKWVSPAAFCDAEGVERCIREARAVASIRHPNIADIYDVDVHEGAVLLVMERLHGSPWSARVAHAPLPAHPLLQWMLPAMRALDAAHRAGVVHRDVKPHNLFAVCDDEGRVVTTKVLDFGLAKLLYEPPLTSSGTFLGSPHYVAPEQAEDCRTVDRRADVYSMGVTLYEALSGQRPHRAESLAEVLFEASQGRARPLGELRTDLPRDLCAAVMKSLRARPDDRFPSMDAFVRAIEPFAALAELTGRG